MSESVAQPQLKRAIGLPLLVFYGLGVTVGAGVYALIGEIVGIAGTYAPLAFVVSGLVAATTAVSYSLLTSVFPRAAGEAYFVGQGLGSAIGTAVGWGIVATAVASSATISLAFSNYLSTLLPFAIPQTAVVLTSLVLLAGFACLGVRESLIAAAVITVAEVGVLMYIIALGADYLNPVAITDTLMPPATIASWSAILSAALVAFFAFLGFEDIVNMGEETVDASSTGPRAIFITLAVSILLYFLICQVAVSIPDSQRLVGHQAPMTFVYESVSSRPGHLVSAIASLAMINGILVQIVMASRVVFGMQRDRRDGAWLATISNRRQTPDRAILLVVVLIAVCALTLPILTLAKLTSVILLSVFTLVNISLWRLGSKRPDLHSIARWRFWGLIAAVFSAVLLVFEVAKLLA